MCFSWFTRSRSAPTACYDGSCRGGPPCPPVVGVCTPVVPLIRHGCAMPPSPLGGEGYSRSVGSAQMSMAFPSSVTAAPCHLPPGEGFIHSEIFKFDSTFRTGKRPVIPLPVPSYTVGYRGSRRIRRADAWRAKDVDWDGLCAGGWPWD